MIFFEEIPPELKGLAVGMVEIFMVLISGWRERLSHLLAFIAVVVIVVAIPLLPVNWRDLAQYGYLGIFLINVLGSGSLFFPVPGLAFAFIGGGLHWNPLLVSLAGSAGSTIGELTGYLAGYSGQGIAQRSKHYASVEAWMRRYGDITVFIMALIPNPFFDAAGLAAGSLRFPVWRFLLAAFLGKFIKYLMISLVGFHSVPRFMKYWFK